MQSIVNAWVLGLPGSANHALTMAGTILIVKNIAHDFKGKAKKVYLTGCYKTTKWKTQLVQTKSKSSQDRGWA